MRNINTFIFGALLILTVSCKDQELEDAMMEYCKCIDEHKGDDLGRTECFEYMDSLQKVYANQPRKKNKIIEKAGECW
jgi:hypothetical protein